MAGSRANVVLANPNGITVNGGSFVNTGRIALTTGQVLSTSDPLYALAHAALGCAADAAEGTGCAAGAIGGAASAAINPVIDANG